MRWGRGWGRGAESRTGAELTQTGRGIDEAFSIIKRFFDKAEDEKVSSPSPSLPRFAHLAFPAQMKLHIDRSPAAKGYQPLSAPSAAYNVRESFGMGNDYLDPEQHFVKTAPEGSVQLNQWPDEDLPEFRSTVYQYCEFVVRLSMLGKISC